MLRCQQDAEIIYLRRNGRKRGCEKSPWKKKNASKWKYLEAIFFFGIIFFVKKTNTEKYYSPKQGRLPVFLAESLEICDPVLAFDEIMEEIGIEQYLKPERYKPFGRPGYSRVNMLKTILFGFMDTGYVSLRELEDRCKVNLRYMYLMDYETPTYRCFGDFINEELQESAEEIVFAVMKHICEKEHVDM